MDEWIYEAPKEKAPELEPPKFTVKTVLNADAQLEATNAVQSTAAKIVSYACIGLCGAMLVAMIVLYFVNGDSKNLLMAALLALTVAFLLYSKFTMPKKSMARWEDNLRQNYGTTELHLTTEFYDLSLIQSVEEDEENLVDAGYSQVFDLKETENLLLLATGKRQWFFLSKEGISGGSVEEFKTFITERMGGK